VGTRGEHRSGRRTLEELFCRGVAYAERFPALPTTLARVAQGCAKELEASTAMRVDFGFDGIQSARAGELVSGGSGVRLWGELFAATWGTHLLVSLDHDFIFAYVDLAFGGDGSLPPYVEARPMSRIEMRLAQSFLARFVRQLEMGFKNSAATPFNLVGELGKADPEKLGGANAPVAIASYRLKAGLGGGELQLAIPEAVLTALKPAFARRPQKKPGSADRDWSQQIHAEITRTPLALRAVLEEGIWSLKDVAALRVGQVIPLNATTHTPVRLDCNGEPMLWCQIDTSGERYKLRVDTFVDREQELMNDILAG